jgi:hypothetical protein
MGEKNVVELCMYDACELTFSLTSYRLRRPRGENVQTSVMPNMWMTDVLRGGGGEVERVG